jgi:uncharacterized protein DUF2760
MNLQRLLIALLPAAAVAAGNYLVVERLGGEPACVSCVAWLVVAPLALALLIAFVLVRPAPAAAAESAPPPPPAEPDHAAALRLLGVLQEEGRFVDFLSEDLAPYPDAQIGAAARGIHEGCRKALGERLAFEPVLRASEGDTVTVEPGFDPAAIRLTGNVTGAPPFRGVLRHAGWRVTRTAFPARRGQDPHILAPAEVEIP